MPKALNSLYNNSTSLFLPDFKTALTRSSESSCGAASLRSIMTRAYLLNLYYYGSYLQPSFSDSQFLYLTLQRDQLNTVTMKNKECGVSFLCRNYKKKHLSRSTTQIFHPRFPLRSLCSVKSVPAHRKVIYERIRFFCAPGSQTFLVSKREMENNRGSASTRRKGH